MVASLARISSLLPCAMGCFPDGHGLVYEALA
jgi:hypothetical protein